MELKKISRREFCRELEGYMVSLIGVHHNREYRSLDLEALQNSKASFAAISKGTFRTLGNGFKRDTSHHYWEKGQTCYKFGTYYVVYGDDLSMYYKKEEV